MRTTNDLKRFGWGLSHFSCIYSVGAEFDGALDWLWHRWLRPALLVDSVMIADMNNCVQIQIWGRQMTWKHLVGVWLIFPAFTVLSQISTVCCHELWPIGDCDLLLVDSVMIADMNNCVQIQIWGRQMTWKHLVGVWLIFPAFTVWSQISTVCCHELWPIGNCDLLLVDSVMIADMNNCVHIQIWGRQMTGKCNVSNNG